MRKKPLFLYLIVILIVSVASQSFAWSGKVIGVAQGDTITVLRDRQHVTVRLYGIDTPEPGQAFSNKAKQFTSEMVLGKLVEVGGINVDHYGRTVSLVYVEGRGVCDELLKAGLAWLYYLYCNLPICAEWKKLESKAQEAGRGLWSEPNPVPPWEFRRKKISRRK
jgi:endonuclease YncB( thermonuclease family)